MKEAERLQPATFLVYCSTVAFKVIVNGVQPYLPTGTDYSETDLPETVDSAAGAGGLIVAVRENRGQMIGPFLSGKLRTRCLFGKCA